MFPRDREVGRDKRMDHRNRLWITEQWSSINLPYLSTNSYPSPPMLHPFLVILHLIFTILMLCPNNRKRRICNRLWTINEEVPIIKVYASMSWYLMIEISSLESQGMLYLVIVEDAEDKKEVLSCCRLKPRSCSLLSFISHITFPSLELFPNIRRKIWR